jgi:hypothetical protein
MKFQTGLIVGLAVGYYYGSKAGRERYEQIERVLEPIRESDAYKAAIDAAKRAGGGAIRETASRAKEAAFGSDQSPVIRLRPKAS